MGYLTSYNLVARAENASQTLADAITAKAKELGIVGYALDEGVLTAGDIEFDTFDSVKWYEHDSDMLALSRAFPEVTYRLHGEGEEGGDLWDCYYRDGTLEYCPARLIYPEPERIKWKKVD